MDDEIERRRGRWGRTARVLVAATVPIAVVGVLAACGPGQGSDPSSDRSRPAPEAVRPTTAGDTAAAVLPDPVVVDLTLFVGGEKVPGRWYAAHGRGERWIALRDDRTWWWGYDTSPRPLGGEMGQPPVISANGDYLARVVDEGNGTMLVGADTEESGEGFGGVDLSGVATDPPPRVAAVTDDGLVLARGADFQWLWRPLIDAEVIDLAETAPGQVVIGTTDAGLLVNDGDLRSTDGTQGDPYLARLSPNGVITPVGSVPTHDVLEASKEWVAYAPPGTVGGEASGAAELQVQRLDGSGVGVLAPPEGWIFVTPGFRWESVDRLLALLVTRDGSYEGLARCRPEPASCVLVDLPR